MPCGHATGSRMIMNQQDAGGWFQDMLNAVREGSAYSLTSCFFLFLELGSKRIT